MDIFYPCLGIKSLGMCAYNPAQPGSIYFSLGNAIAALAFTLAVQQLFKPIYLFRLRAYGLKFIYLSAAIFFGAACSAVAMILPNVPVRHDRFLAYPIVWELVGGLSIGIAYLIAAFVSLSPARIHAFNFVPFSRSGARLLSSANEEDRVKFAEDLLGQGNIERLVEYASAWRRAEMHGLEVEFERLRAIGAPARVQGRPPISAFYLFSHRRELARASFAGTFLRIICDHEFCAVLVQKCSWLTAEFLESVTENKLDSEALKPFVQAIAGQAIIHEESMMAKEVGYVGFATAPVLSNSLFEDWRILSRYDPLGGIGFRVPENPSDGLVRRLNSASKMMLKTALKNDDFWPQRYMSSVGTAYENICREWQFARGRSERVHFSGALHMGVDSLARELKNSLAKMPLERRKLLYVIDPEKFRSDLVDDIASIVYESFECVAIGFTGANDEAWTHVIGVYRNIYPFFDTEPEGMDPLQQQLALKFLLKLRQNMEGWYPSISRVLLAVIRPYENSSTDQKRTAFVLLRDAVYKELQKLPRLIEKKPDKIRDFFPSSVAYDPSANTLTHSYFSGKPSVTALSDLTISDVDLTKESTWRIS